jgi:hypothetical protein
MYEIANTKKVESMNGVKEDEELPRFQVEEARPTFYHISSVGCGYCPR